MLCKSLTHLAAFLALVVLMSYPTAQGQSVVNGDFEASPFDTGWDNTDGNATVGTGFAPGSTQHASLVGIGTSATTDDFFQDTGSRASAGVLSWWLQTTTFDTTQRAFNLVVGTDADTSGINLRLSQLDGTNATLEAFSSGSWNTLSSVGEFDENSIYYFELDFSGLGTGDIADASYSLNWSNANPGSATTSNTTGVVSLFQTNDAISGGTIDRIQFTSRSDWDNYGIDDVSLEPTVVVPASILATIDRLTGEVTLSNPNTEVSNAVTFIGYSLTSADGSLDSTSWTSIDDSYDASGDMTLSTDEWTELTDPSSFGDLSEFDFASAAGATLGPESSVSLGNTWIITPNEDVVFQYTLSDGTIVTGDVEYVNDAPIAGDFNGDGSIDAADWATLRSNLFGDFTDGKATQAYFNGDITGNRLIDGNDFIEFRDAYEAVNGAGSFEAILAAVPEPGSASLIVLFALTGSLAGSRRVRNYSQKAVLPALMIAVAFSFSARPAEALVVGIEGITQDGSDALNGVTIGGSNFNGPFAIADIAEDNRGAGGLIDIAAGDPVLPGTVVDPMDENQGFAFDNNPLTGVAGSINNEFQNGGALALYWGDNFTTGLTDNDADPDFFVFEDLGNDSVEVRAILGNGTVGESVALSGWNTVSSAGNLYGTALTPLGGGDNRTVTGLAFDFTDLLDESGVALTNGTAIRGILIGAENNADFYEIYANIDSAAVPPPAVPLTLQIDPVDGDMQILNTNIEASVDLTFYQIDSALGELDVVGWSSLEDQDKAAFPAGDGSGNGWEEGGLSDSETLGEAYLLGESTFSVGQSAYLGEAVVDNVTEADNITFSYRTPLGVTVEGLVEFVNVEPPVGVDGDYNEDGTVDAADYTVWRDNLGAVAGTLPNDSAGGVIGSAQYDLWVANYGNSSSSSTSTATSVPEPTGLLLTLVGGVLATLRRRTRKLVPVAAAIAVVAGSASTASAIFFDRDLQLGEEEGATVGATVTQSFDSTSFFVDFGTGQGAVGGNPVYADVSAGGLNRPGASADGSTRGITFDGTGDYMNQRRFGNPENSRGSATPVNGGTASGSKNYAGIRDRGMQLWVNPNSSASDTRQSVMHDSNQFGIIISEDNTWILQSNGLEFDTLAPVTFDAWSHVAVVREAGVGTVMFIDGVAIGRASSTYDDNDGADLVLGANTAGTELLFSGGTDDFFTGTLDQVEVFTWGVSGAGPPGFEAIQDYGDYQFGRDNGFARLPDGISDVDGDITGDGMLDQNDIDAFVAGWNYQTTLGFLDDTNSSAGIADLVSYQNGDLDLDGDTDLSDAFLLHTALINSGSSATINLEALFAAVPEPSSLLLVAMGLGLAAGRRRDG